MLTRADHVVSVASSLAHVPEIAELVERHQAVVHAARRAVHFGKVARPHGRLAERLDALAAVLAEPEPPSDPADWDVIEWRRRCAAVGVAQAQLLRCAVDIAASTGAARPASLRDIPAQIAAAVADGLTVLAEGTST